MKKKSTNIEAHVVKPFFFIKVQISVGRIFCSLIEQSTTTYFLISLSQDTKKESKKNRGKTTPYRLNRVCVYNRFKNRDRCLSPSAVSKIDDLSIDMPKF